MSGYKLLSVAVLVVLPLIAQAVNSAAATNWTSIPITNIAKFELNYPNTRSYDIPYSIPDGASEVLVYTVINTGASGPDERENIKIYTQDDYYNVYAKYIAVHPYPQMSWSTNSDNMWFPMTRERKIHVNVPISEEGNADVEMYVIGYRK